MESRLPIILTFLIFKLFETFGQPNPAFVGDEKIPIPTRSLGITILRTPHVETHSEKVSPNEQQIQSDNPSSYNNYPWPPYQPPPPGGYINPEPGPHQQYHQPGYSIPVPVSQPLLPPPGYPIPQQPFQAQAPPPYYGQGYPPSPVSNVWPYQFPQQPIYQPILAPPHHQHIYLGSSSPSSPPCATILTSSNCVLRVPYNGQHHDILDQGFTFVGGLIKDKCALTVQDSFGFYATFLGYLFPSTSTAASVCCQCYGCQTEQIPMFENSCAIIFENVKCSLCHGFRLQIARGDTIRIMDTLVDNKASSVFVFPGCELTVYEEPNFEGRAALGMGLIDELPEEWDNTVSSYHCVCPDDNYVTHPSVISSTPGSLTPIEIAFPTSTTPLAKTSIETTTVVATEPNMQTPTTTASTTTQALETTTVVPTKTTTEVPIISTTSAPLTTAEVPRSTTSAPLPLITTTEAPISTTRAPITTTTVVPITTTPEEPGTTTTDSPRSTTTSPRTTTTTTTIPTPTTAYTTTVDPNVY